MLNRIKLLATVLSAVCALRSAAYAGSDAPLADAAEAGNRPAVEKLIQQGADVNTPQVDGMTALHWAARRDDLTMAKTLVAAGANVKAENRYGVTPLSLVCINGDAPFAELLLDAGADANVSLHGGETALHTAARTGSVAIVKSLLARGADINAKEQKGQTAIMWAAAEGHADVVEVLLAKGAEFRTPLSSGFTPLTFAVREGRIDVVKQLLHAGADVNEAMQPKRPGGKAPARGTSALILAVENGHFELAATLLEAGADPNDQRTGYSPLHTLSWVRIPNRGDGDDGVPPPNGSGNLTSLQFVKALVMHGADVNLQLKRGPSGKGVLAKVGATPFLMAAATGDIPFMRTLIELGADPLLANSEHTTPLLAAAGVGVLTAEETAGTEPDVLATLKMLVELGANVNAVDDNGETAMHGAAYRNFPLVVHFLAEHGAKAEIWNKQNKYGWTPLAIAEGHRFGNFKPSSETAAAIREVLNEAPAEN
jgi:uncharacterized protein